MKSFPSDWVSYNTPAEICTVHINMITSLGDKGIGCSVCMSTERVHTEVPILAPSTQRYGLNILFLNNGFHTLQCEFCLIDG